MLVGSLFVLALISIVVWGGVVSFFVAFIAAYLSQNILRSWEDKTTASIIAALLGAAAWAFWLCISVLALGYLAVPR